MCELDRDLFASGHSVKGMRSQGGVNEGKSCASCELVTA